MWLRLSLLRWGWGQAFLPAAADEQHHNAAPGIGGHRRCRPAAPTPIRSSTRSMAAALAPARSDHHGDFGDAELPGGEYPGANTSPPSARARARARGGSENQGRGRRTRSKRWSIDRLIPYAKNARTHSDAQIAAIAASLVDGARSAVQPQEVLSQLSERLVAVILDLTYHKKALYISFKEITDATPNPRRTPFPQ
jgi:hypothetical protein